MGGGDAIPEKLPAEYVLSISLNDDDRTFHAPIEAAVGVVVAGGKGGKFPEAGADRELSGP